MGRRSGWGSGRGAMLAACAGVLLGSGGAQAAASETVALTLSGQPDAPRALRTMGVGREGVGIRFESPTGATLVSAQTYWPHVGDGCTLALHADADGAPGTLLAESDVPAAPGWMTTPLAAALAGGTRYHLVARCQRPGRLAYVLDGNPTAVTSGAWMLERVRGGRVQERRHPMSPLFALTFADGRAWGQPHGPAGRAAIRLCRGQEIRQAISPAGPMTVSGARLALAGGHRAARVDFTLAAADGQLLLQGPLVHGRERAQHVLRPAAVAEPISLAAGGRYTVRLRNQRTHGGCLRLHTLRTDLALGPPLTGIAVGPLEVLDDDGETRWVGGTTLALSLIMGAGSGGDPPPCPPGLRRAGRCPLEPKGRRSIYASGYFAAYDPDTVPVWPTRLGVVLGEADHQGPLVAAAKRRAADASNDAARFVFYFSLTSLDARCGCFDARFFSSIEGAHPEWLLRDGAGNRLSTFVGEIGAQRQFAVDIGNPAFVDAWADWALAAMERYGWDGVWVDNVLRGNFYGWSGWPVNPRTHARYTTTEYRHDMLAALRQLRTRLDARGKIMIGNHSAAWEADTFADPVVQQQITTMHGVEVEDCVYGFTGSAYPEDAWIAQLRYLDFANRQGVLTQCRGGGGTIGDPRKRDYVLASYLLTKRGESNVAQLNVVADWWDGLAADLGAPRGDFSCLDPAHGLAPAAACPARGNVYTRDWQRGRVLVNPTAGTTVTVPLDKPLLLGGRRVTAVTLPPHSGAVLLHP